ncbi:hypothetical protein SAMN05421812_12539 [Asanoa hainanensis]|uniref:TrbL/VirB6 plasmid conjugal transfer protein n=2 Tax=Asanoa hainanensis TaxID=560556 RepID=A0A239PF21_9ACTN|nr:hypothetical protein SAMN05421812_12539 [Asanoa hainanensis]
MCTPWDTTCIAAEVANTVANGMFGQVGQMLVAAAQWLINLSASWWVMVPSISLYPDRGNTDPYAATISSVANLRALILPITVIIATGGMLWNGLLMVLSRKPAPLVNVLRGLWNTALWSAVGVFGTNLLLAGTDGFATYVINLALGSVGEPSLGKRLGGLLLPAFLPGGLPAGGMPIGLVILISFIAMICAFIQAILMLFRDGAVLILAALTPLAASGSFTNATNGWLPKVMAWMLTLIFYKDFAAVTYAVMIWMTGENNSNDPRILLFGLAMMVAALVALPVLLRFFNWTVGSLQSGGGGLGMLATAGAAGMHAAASMRGSGGGSGVNEHARYLSDTFDRGNGSGLGPPSAPSPGPGPISGTGGGARPPVFQGDVSSGKVASVTSASGSGTAATTGATTGAAAAGAGAGATTGAATSAGVAASAATGPAAPIVAGAVVAVGAAAKTSRAAADSAAGAMSTSTKDG